LEDDLEDDGGDEDEDEVEDEVDVDEEDRYEEVNHHPIVDYNEEDPPMEVGTTYPNMAEFKLALCQHATKHEFNST
jgi:hypothetical protein